MKDQELNSIITQSYKVFRKYKLRNHLDVCTFCCITEDEEQELIKTPLQNIPFELFYNYHTAAKTTVLDPNETKYFLPRQLEFIAEFKFPSLSPEIEFYKVEKVLKKEWKKAELNIINDFSVALFKKCISAYPIPNGEDILGILIMFWNGGIKIEPLLKIWEDNITPLSSEHYGNLILDLSDDLKKFTNPFSCREFDSVVMDWIYKSFQDFEENIKNLIDSPTFEDYHTKTEYEFWIERLFQLSAMKDLKK